MTNRNQHLMKKLLWQLNLVMNIESLGYIFLVYSHCFNLLTKSSPMKAKLYFVSLAICFLSLSVNAQNRILTGTAAQQQVKGADKVFINDQRNTISFIRLAPDE